MKKYVAALTIVLALAGCSRDKADDVRSDGGGQTAGSSIAEDAAEAETTLPFGEPVHYTTKNYDGEEVDAAITVHSVEWKVGASFPGQEYPYPYEPKSGSVLVADVEYQSPGKAPFNHFYMAFLPESGDDPVPPDIMGFDAFAPQPAEMGGRGFIPFDTAQASGSILIWDATGKVYGGWAVES